MFSQKNGQSRTDPLHGAKEVHPMTPELEKQLVNTIVAAFGDDTFDTTSIMWAADDDDETALALASAIEAAIPNCRCSYRHRRGRFKDAPVRRVLEQLAKKHFEVDELGWWRVRQRQSVAA
jgi:hypothetical protein